MNRQSERYRREGIEFDVSTLADQVGACTTVLQPLHALIKRHVLAAERLHGDDITVKLSGIDRHAWLTDVLTRLVDLWSNNRLHELLPWTWAEAHQPRQRAA